MKKLLLSLIILLMISLATAFNLTDVYDFYFDDGNIFSIWSGTIKVNRSDNVLTINNILQVEEVLNASGGTYTPNVTLTIGGKPQITLIPKPQQTPCTNLTIDTADGSKRSLRLEGNCVCSQDTSVGADGGVYGDTTFDAVIADNYTIGANTLTSGELGYLDGQNQPVKTTSEPSFNKVTTGFLAMDTSGLTVVVIPLSLVASAGIYLDGNILGNTTFDTDTLFVDSTNDRVGIGTTTPSTTLEIVEDESEDSTFQISTNIYGVRFDAAAGNSEYGILYFGSDYGDCRLVKSGVDQKLSIWNADADRIIQFDSDGDSYIGGNVTDVANGHSFTVNRFANEGDDYLRFYTANNRYNIIDGSYAPVIAKGGTNKMIFGTIDTYSFNHLYLNADNRYIKLGGSADAEVYYDGTDMIINPKVVGDGKLKVLGTINATDEIFLGGEYIYNKLGTSRAHLRLSDGAGSSVCWGTNCWYAGGTQLKAKVGGVEKMEMTSVGVRIGGTTQNPTETLDVIGNIKSTGNINATGCVCGGAGTGSYQCIGDCI